MTPTSISRQLFPRCAVDAVFQALCDGAAANPDPDAEDDEGDFYYDEVSTYFQPRCSRLSAPQTMHALTLLHHCKMEKNYST